MSIVPVLTSRDKKKVTSRFISPPLNSGKTLILSVQPCLVKSSPFTVRGKRVKTVSFPSHSLHNMINNLVLRESNELMTEQPPVPQLPEPTARLIDGQLRCSHYDDIYFSAQDGLAESRHVFLAGTELADHLSRSEHLVIAETGFGSGLNLCAVMALMSQMKSTCQIDYISIEGNPLPQELATHALSGFEDITPHADELIRNWPRRWPGVHHLSLMDGQVRVQLHYAQAEDILPQLDFKADIWFLDGFSPARNQDFWSSEILLNIGRLSNSGARLASFTVAAHVRASLSEAGFVCERTAGFGHKRHMLKARLDSSSPQPNQNTQSPARVAVIGGGVAGCAVGHHLSQLGIEHVIVTAAPGLADGASGNKAGLVSPHLSAGDSPAAQLAISAFADTIDVLDRAEAVISGGCFALDVPEATAARHRKMASQGYPESLLHYQDKDSLSELAGMSLPCGGMAIPEARVIDPVRFCSWLASDSEVKTDFAVADINYDNGIYRLQSRTGERLEADHLIICAGYALPQLLQQLGCPQAQFQITSGQISHLPASERTQQALPALNYGGYMLAVQDGIVLGASYNLDAQDGVSEQGHLHNLGLVPATLQTLITSPPERWSGRTSFRLATRYRMPICGQLRDNIHILGALGSRGLTHSYFLARHIAMSLARRPDFLPRRWRDAMRTERLFGVNF